MYPYFDVFGWNIPSYGLCMAIGILFSGLIGFMRAHKHGLDIDSLFVIAASAIGLGLAGAKVLYLFVSCDIKDVVASFLQGDMSYLSGGGLVFYGGLIGGIVGALLGARISGATRDLAAYCNAVMPAIPLGHAFGRVGCFLGGCCYGAPYTGFGAVTFPKVGVFEPVFPVQLLEAALNIVIFIVLMLPWIQKKQGLFSLYLYLILYSIVRFVLEFFRGDAIRGIAQGLSTSQWISIGLFLCGFFFLAMTAKREKRPAQSY
ncbi:MAG: prolipoprotein diacylglyceryl transferase [Aristaeellaceae bacterium]